MITVKLVLSLLTAISGYTGYAIPGDPPRITPLPHDALAQRVCGRPCHVLGFTLPSGEIIIDQGLAIGRDPVATSILVHELTHFLQIRSVTHPQPADCRVWADREREAFEVQQRWLREASAALRAYSLGMSRLGLTGVNALCIDAGSSTPGMTSP